MGKQAPKGLNSEDVLNLARQQNFMSNPNQSNRFGSTSTTFDENDQATIVQQLSPELEGLVDQQFGFLNQGPAQLGAYNDPFMQSMMQGTGDAMARRGGYAAGDASDQGGYNSQMPQFGGDPMAQMNLPAAGGGTNLPYDQGGSGLPTVPQGNAPNPQLSMGSSSAGQLVPQESNPMASLAEALTAYSGQGASGSNGYADLGANLGMLAQRLRKPQNPLDTQQGS